MKYLFYIFIISSCSNQKPVIKSVPGVSYRPMYNISDSEIRQYKLSKKSGGLRF